MAFRSGSFQEKVEYVMRWERFQRSALSSPLKDEIFKRVADGRPL